MGGRADYEEKRKQRIKKYEELSEKAKQRSIEYSNSNANRILQMTPGQPIIIGHHSEKRHRRLIEKANNDIKKSIEFDDKSDYYASRAESAKNSKVIYADDPQAIQKLKDKLQRLENERDSIKKREHYSYELTNIGARIRETKLRIKRLEEEENLVFNDEKFIGGKVVHNKEINRIQLIFENVPNEEIRNELKRNGFHWSRKEGAWQRLLKEILNKENQEEEEEEFE